MKILVVDDEKLLVKGIKFNLENEGYSVDACYDGETAVQMAASGEYSLIILDLMMPGLDGLEACQKIRAFSTVPIIMLTARSEDADKLLGFESGADDYITKPFNILELKARIRALLRRANIEATHKLTHGNLVLDADAVSAVVDGQEVPVTMREFNILFKLLSYPNKTFTRAQLMDEFWGMESESTLRAVDVYITKLRDKFSGCTGFSIATVRGLGYKAVLK